MQAPSEPSWIVHLLPSRHLAAATVLTLLWLGEGLVPLHQGRMRRACHAATNLLLALVNAGLLQLIGFLLIRTLDYSQMHGLGLLRLTALPAIVEWSLALLLIDLWQYAWHRLNHLVPWLWRFHAVHHADADMDASTGVRFHTGELALSFAARLIVLPFLGATVPQLLLYEALALPVILFQHSNIRVSPSLDFGLRWVIVTPDMHQVHHSAWQPETDSNFSSVLSFWDRLFGSWRRNDHPESIRLGLNGWHERDWRELPGLLMAPLRRRLPGTPDLSVERVR